MSEALRPSAGTPLDSTTLSSKGQVIIPKAVRDALQWAPGTVFRLVAQGDGILLTPEPLFAATSPAQAAGCLQQALAAQRGRAKPDDAQALRQRAAADDAATRE